MSVESAISLLGDNLTFVERKFNEFPKHKGPPIDYNLFCAIATIHTACVALTTERGRFQSAHAFAPAFHQYSMDGSQDDTLALTPRRQDSVMVYVFKITLMDRTLWPFIPPFARRIFYWVDYEGFSHTSYTRPKGAGKWRKG